MTLAAAANLPHVDQRHATPDEVERAEYGFYLERVRPGDVVADAGAHVGALTTLFSTFVGPQGCVHAFEPGRWAFRRLRAVTRAGGMSNTRLHHMAVTDHVGDDDLVLYDEAHQSWNGLRPRPLANYGIDVRPVGRQSVPVITLDAFAAQHGIARFDLVKLDVEGAELQALRGARQLLVDQRIGCVVFEVGQTTFDFGNRPEEITTFCQEVGYRLRSVIPGASLFPGGSSAKTARFAMHIAEPAS
jgi:FkbM family methyltransferase